MINPVVILYMLLIAGVFLLSVKRSNAGKLLITIAGLWFFLITTPFLPRLIFKSLEGKYSQISDETVRNMTDTCDIIILGGGHTDDKNLSANNQLSQQALSRLVEGIRIHRMIPGSRLVLSGCSGRSKLPQALVLYRTALILGIDSSSMIMQPAPANTQQEAEEYVKNFGIKNNLILVTSAVHMPRALLHFHKAGINPINAPANFILKYGSNVRSWKWIPHYGNIALVQTAFHEYIGIIWAKLGGR